MRQDKLIKLFDFLPKSKVKAGNGLAAGKYPFYTSSETQSKYLDEYQHEPGCLVFGTGGKASIHFATRRFATSTDCIVIRPKPKAEIDVAYVFHFLKGNMRILERGFKGAGLKHISKAYLSEINIPHPDTLDDQKRIAYLLGKVDGLICQRKRHLKQLDEILRSVFLEMFGPHAPGYDSWPLVELKELAEDRKGAMRTGPFGSNLLHSEFTSEGDVAVLGIDNAVKNRFAWGEPRFITKDKYRELKNYRIYPGDVIVTIMGTIGRSAVIPDDIPVAINTKHLAAITLNKEIANPLFISYSIHSSPLIFNQFIRKTRGAIMSGLNLGLIKETKLKRPPIDLQDQFAAIHKKVDNIRSRYHKSLNDLVQFYGALSQKAFKGEMDLSKIPTPDESAPEEGDGSLPSESADQDRSRSLTTEDPQWAELDDYPLSNDAGRKRFLSAFFETFLSELDPDEGFDLNHFWQEAHFRSLDHMGEGDEHFGLAEYELVKQWLFEALSSNRLSQTYEDSLNRVALRKIG